MAIKLSKNLELPIEAVTQTFAILAKRGVGKSFTADVLAEEMLQAGQQVVILDPTGAHWGLRSSADGKLPGFPVVVFGGDHADLPLEEHAGETIAEALSQHRFPAIIDLSLLRKGQSIRFATAFLETLYRKNRQPLHLIVDEADTFAPQRLLGEEARMCGAMEDVVKKGRIRGLGCTLITQRPAVLNKNVLTQCESLFAMRLTHPKDIEAIREWVAVHATPDEEKQVVGDLPTLPVGTGWFWSPGWLGTLVKVGIRAKTTFDSGATPKPGQKRLTPKALAAVDLSALGEKITAAAEEAKKNDPRELKRQIAELQKQLAQRPAAEPVRVEVPVLDEAVAEHLHNLVDEARGIADRITGAAMIVQSGLEKMKRQPQLTNGRNLSIPVDKQRLPPRNRSGGEGRGEGPKPREISGAVSRNESGITARQQRFLDAAATLATLGVEVSRETVSAWVGVHPRGGSVGEELKALAEAGLIELNRGQITVTDAGAEAAGQVDPTEAIQRAKSGLSPRQRNFFDTICQAYPEPISREKIADVYGLHPRGGSLGEDLGRLVGRGLATCQRGQYRAKDFLFAS